MDDPKFTKDWFSRNIPEWKTFLEPLKGKPDLRFLEVGCFEGRATLWLLQNILTDPSSGIVCLDTFEGSPEFGESYDGKALEERFLHNIEPFKEQIAVGKGRSQDLLWRGMPEAFDFIYIDGSHTSIDVLEDGAMAWHILKHGGKLIFDDFKWGEETHLPPKARPYDAVIGLLRVWTPYCDFRTVLDQVYVTKY